MSTQQTVSLPPDLFWEPSVGELVMARPCAKRGVRPFDDYPLRVKRACDVDGWRMFACETTGPIHRRTNRAGRVIETRPCWTGFYLAEHLMPAAAPAGGAC
ncbi:hypothetical protein [Variovorax sp.]|uniref:hypothetical protein n=1 Tax=Variovorax sp. TaxID=1871043 RepID=UPI004037D37E